MCLSKIERILSLKRPHKCSLFTLSEHYLALTLSSASTPSSGLFCGIGDFEEESILIIQLDYFRVCGASTQ